MRNLLVAQSGGPTSAINATIAGVIMEAHASDQVDTIYGAVNGIKGVLEERFVNLSEKVPGEEELEILCQTPAAALGSCRVKLKNPAEDDSQFQEIIRIFRKHEIMYFIYAGGNDSMDTVDKLAAYCKDHKTGSSFHQVIHCFLNPLFGSGIYRRSCFIKDQQPVICKNRSRDRQKLLLSL